MTEEVKKQEAKKEPTEAAEKESKEKEKPIDKMTAKELRDIAKDIPGVTGVHAMKKDALLAIVKEAQGIKEKAPAKKKKVKAAKKVYTVKELKVGIATLKEDKKKARKTGEKEKVEILRRRINRMKKLTRKVARA